jgi:ABC-2 type transport system permease protein
MISSLAKYFGMIRIAVRQRMNYRFDFLMTFIATLIYSALYYLLWKAIYASSTGELSMPWNELMTYIMVGQAINMSRWSPADREPVYGTAERIRTGDIAMDIIRPIGYQTQRFMEAVGFFIVETLWVNIPVLLMYIFLLHVNPPKDIYAAIGFLLSLLVGFIVAFSINSIVIMLTFWTTNPQGLQVAKKALVDILAGTLIPFEFFPGWFRNIAMHLPFQGTAHLPLSIYMGKISGYSIITALFEQCGWALVMLAISYTIWMRVTKRITVFGG